MSLQPQDRPADNESHQRRSVAPTNNAEPGRHAEMSRSDGDRIGADAEKAGMAKADLTGKAHQQIEADDRDREDENQRRDAIVVGGRKASGRTA